MLIRPSIVSATKRSPLGAVRMSRGDSRPSANSVTVNPSGALGFVPSRTLHLARRTCPPSASHRAAEGRPRPILWRRPGLSCRQSSKTDGGGCGFGLIGHGGQRGDIGDDVPALRLVGYRKRHVDTGQHRLRILKIGVENGFVPAPAFRPHGGGIIEIGGSDLAAQHADQVRGEPLRAVVRVAKGALLAEQRPSASGIAALGMRWRSRHHGKKRSGQNGQKLTRVHHTPSQRDAEKWATAPERRLRAPAFADSAKQSFHLGEEELQKQWIVSRYSGAVQRVSILLRHNGQ